MEGRAEEAVDPSGFESNDFDHDLIFGKVVARDGSESHGVRAVPQYERVTGRAPGLAPGTPGHDAGCRLPNFNDGFQGEAPDMGAVEQGAELPVPATWPPLPELR